MDGVKGLYIMPHPPIVMPDIGQGEEKKAEKTVDALKACSKEIGDIAPKTIVLITPHGPVFEDAVVVMMDSMLKGNMKRFGRPDIGLEFENNIELGRKILEVARDRDIPCLGMDSRVARSYGVSTDLDWGALVPLYFVVDEHRGFELVHITISFLEFNELYKFGTAIREAVDSLGEDVVVISSADLSHRLSEDGPYGFNPAGPKLDKAIIDNIDRGHVEGLMNLDRRLIEEGGECGLRSIIMGLGTLDGREIKSNVLSYEGPFGVGYGVVSIHAMARDENPYIHLARKTLETYVKTGEKIKPGTDLPVELLEERAGVFVTLKKDGMLRGCIGTIEPTEDNIAKEIIENAIRAGTEDPRFPPVEEDELSHIVYSVDVLEEPEPIESIEDLDVQNYGVIVKKGMRRGLLLPNIDGVDTPEEQVSIALNKARIRPYDRYSMERFRVIRHE